MAKKKKVDEKPGSVGETVLKISETAEAITESTAAFLPEEPAIEVPPTPPALVVEQPTVSTPALSDKMVRVRNQGKPFLCDLTAYGYGMRWPTNAVYTIPASKYMELLQGGLDGVSA